MISGPNHGGRRKGAGRPTIAGVKLVPRTIRLTPDEWRALDAEAERRGLTTGRLIAAFSRSQTDDQHREGR